MQSKNYSFALSLMMAILAIVFSFNVQAQTSNAYLDAGLPMPTVTSDKDDYAPGEIAHISGAGWTLDQQVHVELKEEPDYPDYHIYDVDVDANGNWSIDFQIERRHIGVKFTVLVSAKQTGLSINTVFTDAPKVGSATISAQSVVYGASKADFAITVNRGNNNSGTIDVAFCITENPSGLSITLPGTTAQGSSAISPLFSISTSSLDAGTYTFKIEAFNKNNTNTTCANAGDFAEATGTLTINKKELTVTANNKIKIYGDVNPALTISYDGFLTGQNASVLTTTPNVSTAATQNSNSGTYDIIVSGGSATNYSFKYVKGTLIPILY